MKTLLVAVSALAALSLFGESAARPRATPAEQAAKNRALYARYKDSVATVRYFVKKNAKGDEPDLRIPYKCPNCGGTHYRDGGANSEKGVPAEFTGFLVAGDRVLMKDVMLASEFVDRIEVECAGETVAAEEFESCPGRDALVLKTERPFSAAKPVSFAASGAPADPTYFFIVREEGETVAGFAASDMPNFRHHVERGKDIYKGNPNTLVLDASGAAVTASFKESMEIGAESFAPPPQWKTEPAAKRFERLSELEGRVRRAVFPVYIQLEAKSKEGGRSLIRWSSDDDVKNDVDAVGLLLDGGRVVVPAKLSAPDTARLSKVEATLPDGSKAVLEFAGSYAELGGFEARFKDGVPDGLEPFALDGRAAVALFDADLVMATVANLGGAIEARVGLCGVEELKREQGNVAVADFERLSGKETPSSDGSWKALVVSSDGKLVAAEVPKRHEGRWSDSEYVQGAGLAELASSPAFDPENVPRAAGDRKRTPWLGVEVQGAGSDILREKKATAYVKRYVDSAPLVTEVTPGTPAEQLGIKVGDILISVKHPGSSNEESLSVDRDRFSEINWEEAFADDRFVEFASSGEITPWPDAEGGVNGTLAQFGVGAEVVVTWVSEGQRKEGKTVLALAPVHFRNAPRARNKELGMTVCDMTYEVRKYFKLGEDASGVVVTKVKGGGVAAVAGIRPLELVLDVNGESVKSAKEFLEKTKGKKDLGFTVRRLTATRMVPIKL